MKTKKRGVNFTVTIEPCVCGSTRGVLELEQDGSLQVPIVLCAECKIEVDHIVRVPA